MRIIVSIILLVVFGCGSTSKKKENKSLNAYKNGRYIYVDVKTNSLVSIKNDSYAPKSFANENEIYIKPAALIIISKENDKTPFQLLRDICIIKKNLWPVESSAIFMMIKKRSKKHQSIIRKLAT